MEPIQILKKAEYGTHWEYRVILGHNSKDVGFLVKINREYWEMLTGGRQPPELIVKKCFRFLLKKQSKYSIWRSFDLQEIQERFPEFENEIRK